MQALTVDSLYPYCYPIGESIDLDALISSIDVLLKRLKLNFTEINKSRPDEFAFTFNLTHLPGLTGNDRWLRYREKHPELVKAGVNEKNFTEHLTESQDLLIGQLIHRICALHEKNFQGKKLQGRQQLIWLRPNQSYGFHRDLHTDHRYHVPIITNEDCFFLLKKEDVVYKVHMPADGRIWYLDPVGIKHTFCNQSDVTRLHLVCTSSL